MNGSKKDTSLDALLHPAQAFGHPSEVVSDPDLTLNEKRAHSCVVGIGWLCHRSRTQSSRRPSDRQFALTISWRQRVQVPSRPSAQPGFWKERAIRPGAWRSDEFSKLTIRTRTAMGMLLVKCHATGKEFSTGIYADRDSLVGVRAIVATSICPHCGAEHTWRIEDATLEEIEDQHTCFEQRAGSNEPTAQ
jgi:hypothetical protein